MGFKIANVVMRVNNSLYHHPTFIIDSRERLKKSNNKYKYPAIKHLNVKEEPIELYLIISNEFIKEGESFFKEEEFYRIDGMPEIKTFDKRNVQSVDKKKIIASSFKPHLKLFNLFEISEDFINKYMESHNNGNIIDEVLIEFDKNGFKLNPIDNTIIIKLID